MRFIHYGTIENTKSKVLDELKDAKSNNIDDLSVFNQIEGWIDKH